jgi:hypothetical protein
MMDAEQSAVFFISSTLSRPCTGNQEPCEIFPVSGLDGCA